MQRALTFVRHLLHHPAFEALRGDGPALVQRLDQAAESLVRVCNELSCDEADLCMACDRVKLLAGETYMEVAAARMNDVAIPPAIAIRMKNMPNVACCVRLLAALAEVQQKAEVFITGADAARVVGADAGSVRRTLRLAVRMKFIELVAAGHRRDAQTRGMASTYRIPWMVASSNRPGNG
jgi:hypothetical protein